MDLSTRGTSVEGIEYRHKKFGHVRSPPMTNSAPSSEEARSLAGSPFSCSSSSTYPRGVKRELEDNDTNWEPPNHATEMETPSTPRKRQRIHSTRSATSNRNKRNASFEICNAPKKCKIETNSRSSTPEKHSENSHALTSYMPKISKNALARICQYNKNMVRRFPKKERTAKDQERRDKNTIACRMSRRLKKLESLAIEEQYKIFVQEHLEQHKQSLQAAVYLNELLKIGVNVTENEHNEQILEAIAKKLGLHYLEKITTKTESKDFDSLDPALFKSDEENRVPKEHLEEQRPQEGQLVAQRKRSFSIAFLLGAK